jgi:hypothetical protein
MKVSEARALAERLGLRLEKVRGRDEWLLRDRSTEVRVAHGLTFDSVVVVLQRLRPPS